MTERISEWLCRCGFKGEFKAYGRCVRGHDVCAACAWDRTTCHPIDSNSLIKAYPAGEYPWLDQAKVER